ncbi:tropinone reductase homolog At5g06060 isoform X3 [Lathyrus oleraceus]|uniref:tropinone reductase homolog At5g06060 isoform X3 n=1 Tax=Pisum sativum TaxID=3888 RepID=UPI001FC3FE92|nr:tropinone reductase homolog At5g06060-like isoform X3 [Pisum sativum]
MEETKLSSFKDKRWSLQGMTVLVTGGTRGIGYAIVEELAEFGAAVHICSRNEEDINKCLEEWKSKGFHVTGSVNNAGTVTPKPILDHTDEDVATIMSTNFVSGYHLCQLAHPLLKESGYASIVFISSIAGLKAFEFSSAYAASKGAMNQFTKNVALEWAKDNIRANVVAPGPVKTLLLENAMKLSTEVDNTVKHIVSRTPVGRMGESEDISGLVAFLCLPASSHITGQIIAVDGGFTM